MRGNPVAGQPPVPLLGSIPARAGEPPSHRPAPSAISVYPRACGGTIVHSTPDTSATGLSPRVRGNLKRNRITCVECRSIPARAGEPVGPPRPVFQRWVYPRACGGTSCHHAAVFCTMGLSPRVLGNRIYYLAALPTCGSIPARAGEPEGRGRCGQQR